MSLSRSSGNVKVVADYSSEDDERETIAKKIRSNVHISPHKVHERHKRDEMKDPRNKRSHRQIRTEENSSDESVDRRSSKGSKKCRINIQTDDVLYDRTEIQIENYSDNSDYDKRHNKKETQRDRYQNKDQISEYDRRDERKHVQKRMHRYQDNSDNNRRETYRNKYQHNYYSDRRRNRYHWEDSDSDDIHKRIVDRFEDYADDQNDRKNKRRENKTERLRNRYQYYESNYERRQRQHYDNDIYYDSDSHNKYCRQETQSEDNSDYDRQDSHYTQGTEYRSDGNESDYDKRNERRQYINKSGNQLESDGINKRKDKQHAQKDRHQSSSDDSIEYSKQNSKKSAKKAKSQPGDGSNKDRKKNKKSMQNSNKYEHDDDRYKINEQEKNKHLNYGNAGTDYSRKRLQEENYQHGSKIQHNREEAEKSGYHNDNNEQCHNRQKDNRKAVRGNKTRDDRGSSDKDRTKDGTKKRHDRCQWDSDDEKDDRRKSKSQQNNNDEYDKRDAEKYLVTERSNIQKSSKKDTRENKNERRKNDNKEKENSEIQLSEQSSRRKDDRDYGRRELLRGKDDKNDDRRERENESEMQSSTRDEHESIRQSGKKDSDDAKKKQNVDDILTRTGGAYIPPARLRAMQASITDKSSVSYQRIAWEALKKSINGLINKVNVSNLKIIVNELFKENIVRAKGILARSIMQAQAASPTFTHVYAALVAIINSKFPHIGELIIKRLIIQFRRSFRRNDKQVCLACTNFIAHLVNQQAAHEVLALEILTLLLENPTDDSVELAVGFLKECGSRLSDATRRGTDAIFERLRIILHDGEVDKRVQYMIEVMFAVRKDKFKDHPTVITELDLVEEEDQFTHLITLEDAISPEDTLNVFKFDPEFETNETKYEEIRKALLESSDSGEDNSDDDSNDDNEEDEDNENETQTIIDSTETNLTSLRRTIYLTIQSSLDFEECAHKLLKLELKPGQIVELCYMILDCCAQQRTYEKFFGLLAQRFCQLNKIYVEPFEEIFKTAYDTIHRFETNKLRNVARFFAHLFYTDAVSWQILSHIKLNEDDTTSSSRIFVKILFQELCEYMGLLKLNERVKDPTMQEAFEGLFPRDSPRNTRFAINFFTSIGLGGLTDELREHLKNTPKATTFPSATSLTINVDDDVNLSSEEARSNIEDSSSSDSSSSDEESRNKKSKRTKKKKKRKNKDKHSKKKKK